jgi:hypothetical protein
LQLSDITFVWTDGKINNGEPIQHMAFGDYTAVVVKSYPMVGREAESIQRGLWSYRVNEAGTMYHRSAEAAKIAAENDLRGRLAARLHAARATVELYGHIVIETHEWPEP